MEVRSSFPTNFVWQERNGCHNLAVSYLIDFELEYIESFQFIISLSERQTKDFEL